MDFINHQTQLLEIFHHKLYKRFTVRTFFIEGKNKSVETLSMQVNKFNLNVQNMFLYMAVLK